MGDVIMGKGLGLFGPRHRALGPNLKNFCVFQKQLGKNPPLWSPWLAI